MVVWKLDRLGHSPVDLLTVVTDLAERSIGFRSITEGIDTTTPGRADGVLHLRGVALAGFERSLIRTYMGRSDRRPQAAADCLAGRR